MPAAAPDASARAVRTPGRCGERQTQAVAAPAEGREHPAKRRKRIRPRRNRLRTDPFFRKPRYIPNTNGPKRRSDSRSAAAGKRPNTAEPLPDIEA